MPVFIQIKSRVRGILCGLVCADGLFGKLACLALVGLWPNWRLDSLGPPRAPLASSDPPPWHHPTTPALPKLPVMNIKRPPVHQTVDRLPNFSDSIDIMYYNLGIERVIGH